jgi:predicted HicB family RNase H-like nuclease
MSDLLKYKDYHAMVHFSTEDDIFYGKILGINDLITFEGQSVGELKKAFREAIEDYLETCKELGKIPEKTYKGSFNIRLSPRLHRAAALIASQNSVTLNDFVKEAIDYAVQHNEDIARKLATR